jgi:hypothetical protein
MKKINAYILSDKSASLAQLPMTRGWMDSTFDRHVYHCFPLSIANRIGWTVSFPEDITFIWDGVTSSRPDHIKILSGEKYAHPDRGNQTVSFNTGIYFNSEKNISLLTMPVPNQFIDGAFCMTTVISSSVFDNDFPIAWMVTRPNVEITIPANTPIASIVPISLSEIQKYELNVRDGIPDLWKTKDWMENKKARGVAAQEKNSVGDWSHFYRDAVDHLGNTVGEHEAKKIVLKTSYENKK